MTPIAVGDRLPDVSLKSFDATGEFLNLQTASCFADRRAVLFGLPGAFTPTCSTLHLPGYAKNQPRFLERGIDLLACLSVNDVFVMRAWAEAQQVAGRVLMLADGNGEMTRALGLETDATAYGMGLRAQRFAMVLDNGRVSQLHIEAPGEYRVSDADYVLRHL
ncbi:peroxiredoxin [Magnetospira thiophila]